MQSNKKYKSVIASNKDVTWNFQWKYKILILYLYCAGIWDRFIIASAGEANVYT